MGWTETCAVVERMRFVMAVEAREETFAAICRRFGVSRKTGYKWLDRYRAEDVEGLRDRSRAPHHHPQAVPAAKAERCLEVRKAHPTWGPAKVRALPTHHSMQSHPSRWAAGTSVRSVTAM